MSADSDADDESIDDDSKGAATTAAVNSLTLDHEGIVEEHHVDDDPESHVEWAPHVFHPSQVGYCERGVLRSKLGIGDVSDLRGTFHVGDLHHEDLEAAYMERHGRLRSEEHIRMETDGITILGHYDLYDPRNDVVVDFKTRNG